jgi:hypothetical protein
MVHRNSEAEKTNEKTYTEYVQESYSLSRELNEIFTYFDYDIEQISNLDMRRLKEILQTLQTNMTHVKYIATHNKSPAN